MRLRGEKVEVEERRRWRGIEVASVLKMFKQQKPHARHQKTVNQDLNKNIPAISSLITPSIVQPNHKENNKILTILATEKKQLSHSDLPKQADMLQKGEELWSRAPIKTSPAHLFLGPTYTGVAGNTRHLLPTSSGGNLSGGLLLRQQGEARLKREATRQQGEAELRGEERQLRRFEGRVRVLSTSYSQHRLKRSSRTNNRSNSTCSFTSTKRRRRRRGRSFAGGGGGGGAVERRSGQYCAPPPPTVSPLRPTYPYKTLYPGII